MEYCLFTGKSITTKSGLVLRQPTIKELNESTFTYSRYEEIMWMLSRYQYEFKFDLEDAGIDHNQLDLYDLFVMLNGESTVEYVVESLNFVFENKVYYENGLIFFDNVQLTSTTIEELREVIMKIFFFEKPKERNPHNEEAKKMIKRQIKMQKNKKVKFDLYSIMFALISSKHCPISHDEMVNKTVHQIYAYYHYIGREKTFDNTFAGIYAGVIKSEDVDFNSINWINKI